MEAGLVPQPLTRSHPPRFTGGQGQADWCSSSCLRRLSIFLPKLKRAQITQTNWFPERLLHGQPLLHAVHTALLPSKPCQGNARGLPWQATIA